MFIYFDGYFHWRNLANYRKFSFGICLVRYIFYLNFSSFGLMKHPKKLLACFVLWLSTWSLAVLWFWVSVYNVMNSMSLSPIKPFKHYSLLLCTTDKCSNVCKWKQNNYMFLRTSSLLFDGTSTLLSAVTTRIRNNAWNCWCQFSRGLGSLSFY